MRNSKTLNKNITNKNINLRSTKGITLIALVITIIVLLILVGVSIALLTGDNGILTKANNASEQTKQQGALEKVKIAIGSSYGVNGLDKTELKTNLEKVEGIDKSTIKDSLPMTVRVDGIDVNIDSDGKATLNSGNTETGKANTPKLTSDMTPVCWDESNNETTTTASDTKWYNYDSNKWANAKTADGSYWVWIPRYEYKILSGEGTSTAGEIDVKFISTSTTTADEGYKIHPAFQDGTKNSFANGEWKSELSGIWVMKYEASSETPSVTNGGGDVTNLKVLSVPGVPSWRGITTGNSYTNAYNYDRSKESHQMKNSEWGAVAYLTQSKYGRNGTEVTINANESYITAGGTGEAYKTNTNQSSTGNPYGIYDISGGAWEYTSAYITNANPKLTTNGGTYATSTTSTPYATVYPYDSTSDAQETNYNKYKESISTRYGDAISETSTNGNGISGWLIDYSFFPFNNTPFFTRGGAFNDISGVGAFAFYFINGDAYYYCGFRVCLAM